MKRTTTKPPTTRPHTAKPRTERPAARNPKAKGMAKAAEAVRQRLDLVTLRTRGRDALDFHTLSVDAIRDALAIAFEAGWNAGYETKATLAQR